MATYATELQRLMRRSVILSVISSVLLVIAALILIGVALSSTTPDECNDTSAPLSYKCEQLLYP